MLKARDAKAELFRLLPLRDVLGSPIFQGARAAVPMLDRRQFRKELAERMAGRLRGQDNTGNVIHGLAGDVALNAHAMVA